MMIFNRDRLTGTRATYKLSPSTSTYSPTVLWIPFLCHLRRLPSRVSFPRLTLACPAVVACPLPALHFPCKVILSYRLCQVHFP